MAKRAGIWAVVCGAMLTLGIVDAAQAQQVDTTPGAVVFLNRQGGVYRPGFDSPINNTSPILSHVSVVPAFGGDDDDWESVLRHAQTVFAPFDVTVTDVEPNPSTFYIEAVVGGQPASIGLPSNVIGVAPAYCSPAKRSIVFIFSDAAGGDNTLIAQTIGHEVGHAFSLDHEFLCKDPMSYLSGCGEKRFQNRAAACGEFSTRPCFCAGTTQSSFETIRDAFGSRDGSIKPLAARAEGSDSQPAWVCETPDPNWPFRQR